VDSPRVGSLRNKSSTKFYPLPSPSFLSFLSILLAIFSRSLLFLSRARTSGVFYNYPALFRETIKVHRQSSEVFSVPLVWWNEISLAFFLIKTFSTLSSSRCTSMSNARNTTLLFCEWTAHILVSFPDTITRSAAVRQRNKMSSCKTDTCVTY